jgi:uncharacterized membrane protein YphA (DoxX/SURF4 family)
MVLDVPSVSIDPRGEGDVQVLRRYLTLLMMIVEIVVGLMVLPFTIALRCSAPAIKAVINMVDHVVPNFARNCRQLLHNARHLVIATHYGFADNAYRMPAIFVWITEVFLMYLLFRSGAMFFINCSRRMNTPGVAAVDFVTIFLEECMYVAIKTIGVCLANMPITHPALVTHRMDQIRAIHRILPTPQVPQVPQNGTEQDSEAEENAWEDID